jgi:hypothetical protein
MSWSLQDIENNIAGEMDQSATAPTAGGTDWNIRLNAINRSLIDWSNSNEWNCLKAVHNGIISTSTGNASYVLPANFAKLESYPRIVSDGQSAYEFPVVNPSKNNIYTEADKFVNILGSDSGTKVMYIHAPLVSGASVQFIYWKSAATLSSATQTTDCPDPTFLVQRALYYLYKGSEDGRFPEAKVEADRILARMIENENSLGLAYEDRRVPNELEEKYNFRIGRDG